MPLRDERLLDVMHKTRRRLDCLCGELLSGFSPVADGVWRPPMDVFESAESVLIKVEAPGMRVEDTEVVVEGSVVTLRGMRRDAPDCGRQVAHQMEIRYGRFERRVAIDGAIDPDGITSRYAGGFLEVTVPKARAQEARRVRLQF